MPLFPIALKVRERLCVVVGGGPIAESKIQGLLAAEAHIVVVAPQVTEAIAAWARDGRIEWQAKTFAADDLCSAFLVVAGTSAADLNHEVFRQCEAEGILCNVVDDPDYCHFYYPAVVRRGALQIAISTEGHSPALAQRLRRELEAQFGPEYEEWLEWLGAVRQALRSETQDPEETKRILHRLASREMFHKFLNEGERERSAPHGSIS
ncbi:MAG: bifunctional precorrin-2 dehydrogenase/sirohydrochlorin ferrochelatase [Candidatus Acidiferrales bacterium]